MTHPKLFAEIKQISNGSEIKYILRAEAAEMEDLLLVKNQVLEYLKKPVPTYGVWQMSGSLFDNKKIGNKKNEPKKQT